MGTALIYCRVSTRSQSEEGTSLEGQEDECVAHALKLGYELGPIFREVHSGFDMFDRPQLNELRELAKTGNFTAVIVWKIDRLSRKQGLVAYLFAELERRGCQLISIQDPIDDSAVGHHIRNTMEFVAEMEREAIRDRMMGGRRRRVQAGKIHNWGFPPYGYRLEKGAACRTIHEPEAAIVRSVYRWVDEDGLGIGSVVRRLNELGVPPPSTGKTRTGASGRWGTTQVARMLHRTDYKGEAYAFKLQTKGKQVSERPVDERMRVPDGASPVIVPADLWDRVQAKIAVNWANVSKNEKRPYLLRGLIWCGRCGCRMTPKADHGRPIYRCSSHSRTGSPCGGSRIPAGEMEAFVWSDISERLQNPERVAAELERLQAEGPSPVLLEDRETIKKAISKNQGQQQKLARRLSDAPDDDTLWTLVQSEIQRLEAERRQLVDTAAELVARIDRAQAARLHIEELTGYLARVGEKLERANFEQKRMVLDSLGIRVTGNGRKWDVEYRRLQPLPDSEAATVSQPRRTSGWRRS
jgi:site-specific DNA recombinase